MQRCVGWINHEWLIGDNLGGLPPTVDVVIVDLEHVVSLDSTEGVLVIGAWLLLEDLSLVDLQIT